MLLKMKRYAKSLTAAACIITTTVFWLRSRPALISPDNARLYKPVEEPLVDILNETLGFEKIFAIGLPERTDKRDALTLGGAVTGLHIDWIDGVRSKDIPPKAYPIGWKDENHREKPSELGSWRAHMNAMRKIVDNKLGSALIFEDDADWDVSFKAQMIEFARGSRIIQGTKEPHTSSPYGDDWDMLWLGHCGMRSADEERGHPRFYVIPNDPTVRPRNREIEFVHPSYADHPEAEHSRLVFAGSGPICSTAIAVTYAGAKKILAALSMKPVDHPVDLGYNFMCGGKDGIDFKCVAPYPSLINGWKQAGPASRDSDIDETGADEWHEAYSNGIVYSTMLNIIPLVKGSTVVRAQWDDVPLQEIDLRTFEIPRGSLVRPPPLQPDAPK